MLGDLKGSVGESYDNSRGYSEGLGVKARRATTKSDPRLLEPFNIVLGEDGKKEISEDWLDKLSPAAIAVWLADDGSHGGKGYGIRAGMVTFDGRGADLLEKWCLSRGWPVTSFNRKSDGSLYFNFAGKSTGGQGGPSPEIDKFWKEVAPFFPECMERKVPALYRHLVGTGWTSIHSDPDQWSATVVENLPLAREEGSSKRVRHSGWKKVGTGPTEYCLQVEDNHNFLANGYFVSNCKFEQHWFLYKYNIELWPIFDTFRASVLIHNGKDMEHHLWALFERELGVTPMAQDLGGSDWSNPQLTQQQKDYAAEDVVYLLRLREKLKKQLFEWNLQNTALIEFGSVLPETAVELNGIPFDSDHWMSLARKAVNEADKLRKSLVWKMPNPKQQMGLPGITPGINLDSNSQLLSSLRKLGGPIQHLENTTEMALSLFAADYPIIEDILEYRGYQKKSTQFGSKFLTNIHDVTGRIHSSYYPFTGAGRFSNSKPNLQQIPRDLVYRQTFRAPEGKRIVVADYSNIEMRICAEVTQDPKLIEIFNSDDDDAHRATAAMMAGIPKHLVAKTQRQEAKAINFGLIYGMGAPKLVLYAMANYGVTMSLGRAREVRNKFLGDEGYGRVAEWHSHTMTYQRPKGMTRTLSGRLRYLGEDAYNEFLNCVDAKTEALTKRGWVKGFDLRADDVLLTKNAESGKLEWQKPTDLKFWPNYKGELTKFESRNFSAVSTEDHRWLVYNKGTGKDECRVTKDISDHGDHRIHRTGEYKGSDASVYSDEFVSIVGWWVTDGSLYEVKARDNRLKATLTQSDRANPEKVAEIDSLLVTLGWGHSRHIYEETKQITWHLQKRESLNLAEVLPGKRLNMSFLCSLTSVQCQLLFDAMIKGDGHIDNGRARFTCASLYEAEMFQVLCTLVGKHGKITKRDMSKYKPTSKYLKNVPNMTHIYVVNVCTRDKVPVTKSQKSKIAVDDGVWCPIVPNTYFVARREGHVYVTGNTPIQGTGADGLKASLREVYFRMKKYGGWNGDIKMIHHVHDEIVLETTDDPEIDRIAKQELCAGMQDGMEQFVKSVPVKVEPESGYSWGDAK